MPQYNLKNNQSPEINYSQGLLPQRNQAGFWYSDTSCRSNLKQSFQLNSETAAFSVKLSILLTKNFFK